MFFRVDDSRVLAEVDADRTLDQYVVNNRLDDVRDRGGPKVWVRNQKVSIPPDLAKTYRISKHDWE